MTPANQDETLSMPPILTDTARPIYAVSTHFGGPWHEVSKEKYDTFPEHSRTILYAAAQRSHASVRDAFEAWHDAAYPTLRTCATDRRGDGYHIYSRHTMWQAWKAASTAFNTVQAAPTAVREGYPDPLLMAHTQRIGAWMRCRAYADGAPIHWTDTLMEMACEIEQNEIEGCGHAAPLSDPGGT